jgi:GTP-binding protein Era
MKKYGIVAVIGRPNTGKSTLLNAVMNQKVAITSPLPQTTRKNVRVRFQDERGIIDFIDTPGIMEKVEDLVGKKINKEAPKSLSGADVVVCLLDISRQKNEEDNKMLGLARKSEAKKFLVYNKIDIAFGPKDHLAEYNYMEEEFDEVMSLAAIKGKNIKGFLNILFELLPEGEPEEQQDIFKIPIGSKEFVAEIIREKAFLFLRREVPYSVTVEVEEIEDKEDILVIKASVLTRAERYKKMIIGRAGKKIKEIGYNARKELELMTQRKVYLDLIVRVDKHWEERL